MFTVYLWIIADKNIIGRDKYSISDCFIILLTVKALNLSSFIFNFNKNNIVNNLHCFVIAKKYVTIKSFEQALDII